MSHFAANNIVFIVDISASMNTKGKLDLLKMSMIELAKHLRKEDHVTLVAYSSKVNLLLENVSGSDQAQIIQQIKSLKAGGSTAGGDAI